MKYIKMNFAQIEKMAARVDGYDSIVEWMNDTPKEDRDSIHDLVDVFDIFCRNGAKYYTFLDDRGRWCVWIKE